MPEKPEKRTSPSRPKILILTLIGTNVAVINSHIEIPLYDGNGEGFERSHGNIIG
jgi:hypothetical protein